MIYYTLEAGGSGHASGIHYYMDFVKCPHRARMNEASKLTRTDVLSNNEYFQIGTLYHALLELFYKPASLDNPDVVVFRDGAGVTVTPEDKCLREAQRMFKAYKKVFRADEFEVVEQEECYPKNEEQAALIEQALGIRPFTFKPDMIVRCETKPDCANEYAFEPGYYMVDHKTAGRRDEHRLITRENSLQFQTYMAAWNALFPDRAVKGLLCRVGYKLKEPTFETIFVPAPTEFVLNGLRSWFEHVNAIRNAMPDWANLANCETANKMSPCYYLTSKTCKRFEATV